jgi:hypothetical protein
VTRPDEDDREAVDRAFADLVAGFHLTSDRPDPLEHPSPEPTPDGASTAARAEPTDLSTADPGWSPPVVFRFEPPPEIEESVPRARASEERFVPVPLMPLPRPAWPVLVAWIAMGYAVLAVLAAALGLNLPRWAGWLALFGFMGGFGLLVSRLPRHRPPDAGDGAVL